MNKTNIKRCESLFEKCSIHCLKEKEYFFDVKEVFNRGELIVYPTETLYALGTNPFDKKAIEKLFEVKRRPRELPISIAVSDIEMMKRVAIVTALAEKIYDNFLPGPITLLLKKKGNLPDILALNTDKIGIRVPKHPAALKMINIIGPITATSANIHNHPVPKNLNIALEQLGENVMLYIDCGESEYQGPSTIVDVSNSSAKIIRKGVIPTEEIQALIDQITL